MKAYKVALSLLLFLLLVGCDANAPLSLETPTRTPAGIPTETTAINTPTLAPPTNTAESPSATPTEPIANTSTASPPPATPTLPQPTVTATVVTPTPPPVAAPPTPADHCLLTSLDDVTIFTRPDGEAAVFGSLPAGDSVVVAAMTANVWFGFDPGVAQAPNVGPFRYRWIPTSPAIILEGGTCDQLPIVEGPPPGVCFAMVHGDMPVLSDPDPAAEVVAMLSADDYVEAIGRLGTDWYQVDLSVGSEDLDQQGWITGYIDFNGPCQDLPELQP